MAVTDIATLILSIFFLIRGASRGFMHSLMGPFSIIAATTISIIYYQMTKDIIVSLIIGLIGPLLLNLFLKSLLKTWAIATNRDIKNPNFLSRLGGSALTLLWGWVFIAFALILLAVLPPWGEKFAALQHDVTKSTSYLIIKPLEKTFFALPPPNAISVGSKGQVQATMAFDAKSLAQDPRFQKILQDPDIQKEINAHDMVKLMGNPKMMGLVQQIMSDPATMQKVMAIYKNQTQPQAIKNP